MTSIHIFRIFLSEELARASLAKRRTVILRRLVLQELPIDPVSFLHQHHRNINTYSRPIQVPQIDSLVSSIPSLAPPRTTTHPSRTTVSGSDSQLARLYSQGSSDQMCYLIYPCSVYTCSHAFPEPPTGLLVRLRPSPRPLFFVHLLPDRRETAQAPDAVSLQAIQMPAGAPSARVDVPKREPL